MWGTTQRIGRHFRFLCVSVRFLEDLSLLPNECIGTAEENKPLRMGSRYVTGDTNVMLNRRTALAYAAAPLRGPRV